MSRVFKRPMFRKGGEVMGGIMNGIKPRQNFQEGMSAKERLLKVSEEYPTGGFDPLTQFLIQGGLSLISQPKRGGTLATIAEAVKEPTQQLFTGMAKRGSRARDIALAGEQLDIAAEQAQKLAEIKARKKDATNLASFEVKHRDQPYSQMRFTYDKKTKDYKADVTSVPIGFITFNPRTGLAYKRLDRKTNTFADFQPLNPDTLQPLE